VLCAAIAATGVRNIWALGSAKIGDVLGAARERPDLTVRGVSHEKDAVFAADGEACLGHPSAAAFIGSVGLTSAAVAIEAVVREQRPVLLLIGQSDPSEPPGWFQDTRLSDAAVLEALGCPAWKVHDGDSLTVAWSESLARQGRGGPAALLIDEKALRGPWRGPPLPAPRRGTPEWRPAGAGKPLPEDLSREAIFRGIERTAVGAHVFVDAGQARHVARAAARGFHLHDCPRSAPLGWAIPAAMGAATIEPVFAVCGDGGFMMSLAALAALGQHRLPVTVIVAVNGILGVDAARSHPVPCDLRIPDVSLAALCGSMNLEAGWAESPEEITAACRTSGRPRVILVRVPAFEPAAELVP